ncbi:hypothetical protein PTKIN_Ptkin03bG0013800 [Pterospermum kingtungense]
MVVNTEGYSSSDKTDSFQKEKSRDWRKLFVNDQKLNFVTPKIIDGESVAAPPPITFEKGEQKWKKAVVVQFIGKLPNFSLFNRTVNALWGFNGTVEVNPIGSNLFVVQLPSPEMRDHVLESGPWHIQNKPLIVRKWSPGIKALDFDLSSIPIWLHLKQVPLKLFSRDGWVDLPCYSGSSMVSSSVQEM